MKHKVHYIFSIGYRCTSGNALRDNGLRSCSGPFDYMYIDLETCFRNIANQFHGFLDPDELVTIHKNNKTVSHTKSVHESIIKFVGSDEPIKYMAHDYSHIPVLMNQKFTSEWNLSENIYEWDNVCIFHHHNVNNPVIRNKIGKRCNLFNRIYETQYKHMNLFHITQIVDVSLNMYKAYIKLLVSDYQIRCMCTIIVCTVHPFQKKYEIQDNILFIFKRVPSYEIQSSSVLYTMEQSKYDRGTDNNYHFTEEIEIMKSVLPIKLHPYKIIQETFNHDTPTTL